MWTRIFYDIFPLDGETQFLLFVKILFLEKIWSRHLFLVYCLKGKQNKKENLKCDSRKEKAIYENKVGSKGQVTYWEGMVVSHSNPLSPKKWISIK